jgi:GTP-binding protein
MIIKSSIFIKSSRTVGQCPKGNKPEYAFIGRSNVGKSSLINFLTNRKKLAKTSSTPGKTLLINHFLVNDEWYLVDLPGYGYARTGKSQRKQLSKIIADYISRRQNLSCLFLLLDARHEAQEIDRVFIEWLGKHDVPFALVFTKTDKISLSHFEKNKGKYEKLLMDTWEELPPIFDASVKKKTGRDEILDFIEEANAQLEGSVSI